MDERFGDDVRPIFARPMGVGCRGAGFGLPLTPRFTEADSAPMTCSAHLSQISSLGKLLYGIWRACAPFRNILGGFP